MAAARGAWRCVLRRARPGARCHSLPVSPPHPPVPLCPRSHQVDCVNSALGYSSAGCNGGYSSDVLRYVSGFRATTEGDYRYSGTQGTCKEPMSGHPAVAGSLKVAGYTTLAQNKAAIAAAV